MDNNYSAPQPPTLNRATNLAWESKLENQINQQWLTDNGWTIAPATALVGIDIAHSQEREQQNTQKRPYTGYSNRQCFQSKDNTKMQSELSNSKK